LRPEATDDGGRLAECAVTKGLASGMPVLRSLALSSLPVSAMQLILVVAPGCLGTLSGLLR